MATFIFIFRQDSLKIRVLMLSTQGILLFSCLSFILPKLLQQISPLRRILTNKHFSACDFAVLKDLVEAALFECNEGASGFRFDFEVWKLFV